MITEIKITPLLFPLAKPFSNHIRKITHITGLEVRIATIIGIIGHAFIYGLNNMPHEEIINILESRILPKLFSTDIHIEDATQLMSWWKKIWPILKAEQHTQSELTALAIVDIAIWDILMKDKKTSLNKFLGGKKAIVPVYATTGWLSLSAEDLISECKEYKKQGVNAFKIRLGHKEDIARVRAVRNAMGDQFILILDANQRYSSEEAIQISKDFSSFNILWLEEPTINKLGLFDKTKESSVIPIALGENIIAENDFIEICKNGLTDILQIDLPRAGGITGFIRILEIALEYRIPVCNHLLYELSISLVSAYENGYMLECDNLLPSGIFSHDFKVIEGCIQPPDLFGSGVELTESALHQYGIYSHTVYPNLLTQSRL